MTPNATFLCLQWVVGSQLSLNKSANGKPENYSIYQITGWVGRPGERSLVFIYVECAVYVPGFMPFGIYRKGQ